MTKELTETIAKALVDNPSGVTVREEENGNDVTLVLSVDPADMGKIIGKQGRIANALRTVVKAASVKEGRRVEVEIV
ncbi:MAG: KH domain-containing protein [Lachnospiraceae bacterium]|nr:KH domain-containing protein [Lachnospiraceae bacterium]